MKYYRTKKNGAAIWKILEHREMQNCPECRTKQSMTYLGFVETYSKGLHAKMYQCNSCDTWVDIIWEKKHGRYTKDEPAGV